MCSLKHALIGVILFFALIGLTFSAEQKPAAPAAQPAPGTPAAKPATATPGAPAAQAAPTTPAKSATPAPAAQTTPATTAKQAAPAAQATPATTAKQAAPAAPAAQAAPATQTTSPSTVEMWAPADEGDWAVYMDAPAYHFALVKEYLQKGDAAKASAELKRANEFLSFQKNRLSIATKQIEELANNIAAGKEKDVRKVDTLTYKVLKVIDYKFAMLPIEVNAPSLFADEYKYHLEKAKAKLQGNDKAGAAGEIRRAAAFMKLKATHIGYQTKADIDAVTKELKDLAAKVESGAVKGVKELEQVFQKAIALFAKKK